MARSGGLERIAETATRWSGTSLAVLLALSAILLWAAMGPVFSFSDTWQLVINTSTTIVTFVMVFLIQRAQNKESRAIQLKLNELVAAVNGASGRLINVEDMSEKDLETLHRHYMHLAKLAKHEASITDSHSVEEAEKRHHHKHHK